MTNVSVPSVFPPPSPVDAVLTEVNPLIAPPVLGPMVGYVDKAAIDMGMPLWLREFVELVLLGVFVYIVLRLIVRRLLPWVGEQLVDPIIAFVDALRVLFLLPDLAVTRVLQRLDRRPADLVYFYGNGVLAVADGLSAIIRQWLPGLVHTRRIPRSVLVLLLAAMFIVWNDESCVPGADAVCTSLVSHWTDSFTGWIDEAPAS